MPLPAPWRPTDPPRQHDSGQAHVFRVRRPEDPRSYALKRLKNPKREDRFEREVDAMKALAAQGVFVIPPVVEGGRDEDGRPYFVMPWYDQGSLEEVVQSGRMRGDSIEALTLLVDVASGLAAIHAGGWAHRDVKPANILLDEGRPLLGDLGLTMSIEAAGEGRLTATQEQIGSRLYIAPENESGFNQEQDQRPADFYAFGKVGWALLAGETPPSRERQLEPEFRLAARLDRPALAAVDSLAEMLLRTDPRARLQDWPTVTAELNDTLERLRGRQPLSRDPASAVSRAREAAQRYAATPGAYAARLERERGERVSRRYAELHAAVTRELNDFNDAYNELTGATRGAINFSAAQGDPALQDVLMFSPLRDAGMKGALPDALQQSLGQSAALIVMSGQHEPLPPAVYLAGYVYVDARVEKVWFVRLPLVFTTFPGGQMNALEPLRARFGGVEGPFPLALDRTTERAAAFGRSLAADGLELAAEYLEHLAAGRDLLNDETWQREGPARAQEA